MRNTGKKSWYFGEKYGTIVYYSKLKITIGYLIMAVAHWVRALVPQAEGRVFESQTRQI